MKISREWLQTYFEQELPDAQMIADALTFHAFEVESIEGDILDVKVTPNRGHDCLSHRGIAKELSAILNVPIWNDMLRQPLSLEPKTDAVRITIEKPELCARFTAAYITGLTVGPSPDWLRAALESVGQKSINNVVDATNYVMFNAGQPLHAFDAGKLRQKGDAYWLTVRLARQGEKMLGLDDKEYILTSSMLTIADGNTGEAASVAGIKGGKPTGIDGATTAMILEAANWDGVTIRKTSQALKLRTDASDRFQQVISPELAAYGLKAGADLIVQLAGGKIEGFVDEYPRPAGKREVAVALSKVNAVLGTELATNDVADVFTRLGLSHVQQGEEFVVTIPFERLDLVIPEDLIEEIARIIGYDKIPAVGLPALPVKPEVNQNFAAAEKVREGLIAKGYSEVFTSVFAEKGERVVANKVDGVRPYLRSNLADGLKDAYERNIRNKELLGLNTVRLFEIGTIWKNGKEVTVCGTADEQGIKETPIVSDKATTYEDLPISKAERYKIFSKYPFIVRDIAMWVKSGDDWTDAYTILVQNAGPLLVHCEKFDEFKKGEKTSLAFRLVFQSFEKTLTDEEANGRMEKVYAAVKEKGWEVR